MPHKCKTTAIGYLGRGIFISPKANVSINKGGHNIEYYTDTVDVRIGIGKDHSAILVMDAEAWQELNKGAKISIELKKAINYKSKYK